MMQSTTPRVSPAANTFTVDVGMTGASRGIYYFTPPSVTNTALHINTGTGQVTVDASSQRYKYDIQDANINDTGTVCRRGCGITSCRKTSNS